MTTPLPFWNPQKHADRRAALHQRNRVLDRVREWFRSADFFEVDTALLQVSPGNEAHIGAFATHWHDPSGHELPLYLHTSPEFACKKLLAAGETRIFSTQHVFRNGERSPLHHPEFTMLEWYRAGGSVQDLMDDCAKIVELAANSCAITHLRHKDRLCDPHLPPQYISVADAFANYAGFDLVPLLPAQGAPEASFRDAFARASAQAGVRITADDHWSDIFSKVLSTCVEPHLGLGRLTFLTDYPAHEAALARANPADARFAERFELYACGVELANGFGELTDAAEQRRRFESEMDERERIYGERYPIDDDLLRALAIMPPASGCALGFDRLVMLCLGAARIEDVIWTPMPDIWR